MDMNIRKIANKIGVSYSRLSSWFKGSSNMKIDEVESTLKELEENRNGLSHFIDKARLEIELLKTKENISL